MQIFWFLPPNGDSRYLGAVRKRMAGNTVTGPFGEVVAHLDASARLVSQS